MTGVVLDAGALVALERNDRSMWAVLKLAALEHDDVVVPSAALAQVWRGAPTQAMLARAMRQCVLASFDAIAREIGELCGKARTNDVCDAQVALVAHARGGVLYTSDPRDLRQLLDALGASRRVTLVRC